jgi:hypothetical protein
MQCRHGEMYTSKVVYGIVELEIEGDFWDM